MPPAHITREGEMSTSPKADRMLIWSINIGAILIEEEIRTPLCKKVVCTSTSGAMTEYMAPTHGRSRRVRTTGVDRA